jgi:hypothetical protein
MTTSLYYPVCERNLETGNTVFCIRYSPATTNGGRKPLASGWLGTTDGVSRTALGECKSLQAAIRACRAANKGGPRLRWNYCLMDAPITAEQASVIDEERIVHAPVGDQLYLITSWTTGPHWG